jgi:hypothetical protein
MNGNYSTRRNEFQSPQPRLPPLVKSPTYRGEQQLTYIDQQTYNNNNNQMESMQALVEERRARQMLEEQVKVIVSYF